MSSRRACDGGWVVGVDYLLVRGLVGHSHCVEWILWVGM